MQASVDFSGTRALAYTREFVSIGSRWIGSPGHAKAEDFVRKQFQHDQLEEDTFTATTPAGPMEMHNFIVRFPGKKDGVIVLASRSHNEGDDLDRYLAGIQVAERIAAGSSLKFCRIAEGLADLYPRFGRTMEWDTAAGHAVLAAAGGHVVTVDGKALAYGKAGFANPDFIARGNWS